MSIASRLRARTPWSLQRRLVVGIMLLLAVVSVAIGTVSTITLSNNLLTRLDDQVEMSVRQLIGPGPGDPDQNDIYRPGALVLVAPGGVVQSAAYRDGGADSTTALTEDQQQELLDLTPGTDAQSVDLGGDAGSYRVISIGTEGSDRLVVGLPLDELDATIRDLVLIIALVTLAALIVAALVGRAIVRVTLRPLDRVAATATRVSELPLDRGEVVLSERVPDADTDERTEVGQVGSAINRMLGHVASALSAREASERKVRQFVADASHELRTPLASIRGYAELTRRGGHDLPDDVVRSMDRVESEAIRMTSLVEDLLLLARLDEGRDLEVRPVDLSRLLVDAVSDAYVASSDHEFGLDVPAEPVIVPGDDPRLHQVFTNLLANARVHTPPGTDVEVALSVTDAEALVTITDDGPGIPPELVPDLFERFARGDTSRSRLAGSTGLGLAIVRAIVAGHHGTVDVTSRPGRTEFAVRLPLAAIPQPPSATAERMEPALQPATKE